MSKREIYTLDTKLLKHNAYDMVSETFEIPITKNYFNFYSINYFINKKIIENIEKEFGTFGTYYNPKNQERKIALEYFKFADEMTLSDLTLSGSNIEYVEFEIGQQTFTLLSKNDMKKYNYELDDYPIHPFGPDGGLLLNRTTFTPLKLYASTRTCQRDVDDIILKCRCRKFNVEKFNSFLQKLSWFDLKLWHQYEDHECMGDLKMWSGSKTPMNMLSLLTPVDDEWSIIYNLYYTGDSGCFIYLYNNEKIKGEYDINLDDETKYLTEYINRELIPNYNINFHKYWSHSKFTKKDMSETLSTLKCNYYYAMWLFCKDGFVN